MAVTFGDKVEYETNGQQVIAYIVALRRDGYAQVAPSVLIAPLVLAFDLLLSEPWDFPTLPRGYSRRWPRG